MESLFTALAPELLLVAAAAVIFLFGTGNKPIWRLLAPTLSLAVLVFLFAALLARDHEGLVVDPNAVLRVDSLAIFFKTIVAGIGGLLLLLAWPTFRDGGGNPALDTGTETAEFFALALLSLAGVMLVAGTNDIMLLFLGVELASIPTYIMVSISRPLPVAQEAGVKYFFLGAMSAALMVFGFSYLYGISGVTRIDQVGTVLQEMVAGGGLSPMAMLGVLLALAGFAFKMAAFPLHFYAADVYQGAATPVTAFLSFVPKATGLIAILKLLHAVGGDAWNVPPALVSLMMIVSIVTMTIGNTLGLLQHNVKRVMAYSSIAHSGYLLAGVTVLIGCGSRQIQDAALAGVLFYIVAYGLMNIAVFGSLILLPSRTARPADGRTGTSAETFEDILGVGKDHVALALAMSVGCFGLIGLPMTIGFFGKFQLIAPALQAGEEGNIRLVWLAIILVINAAISLGYYLRIVGTMFLRNDPHDTPAPAAPAYAGRPVPIHIAVVLSALLTVALGTVWPAVQGLTDRAQDAARGEDTAAAQTATDATEGHGSTQM
jgi:NADH-quinone oxidoreductase subunit N